MKINRIILHNFRQYYGRNVVELPVESDKNIIIIGGRNGYGKTNLLVSLVWCLYGEDIFRIDESFKKEIRKEGNYSKFLKGSLNWQAAKEKVNTFSVEIEISGVALPESIDIKKGDDYKCRIVRGFDALSTEDSFDIIIEGINRRVFNTIEDKVNFINDYLIPVEAAKFVFFDAEKIASWAELSIKEEGSVLNDAVGKILGLDIYESLINDLKIYTDGQRKESATNRSFDQISYAETAIANTKAKLEETENELNKKTDQIEELKNMIAECEAFLAKHSNKSSENESLEKLYLRRTELRIKEKQLENRFNELNEIIPFALAAGKLEEVTAHLQKQEQNLFLKEKRDELVEKNNDIIEKLFNSPPFPPGNDISFNNKAFYAEKAKKIIEEVFFNMEEGNDLSFSHDLTKSETELIFDTYHHIGRQSKDVFEQTIDSFTRVKNDLPELDGMIKRIEGNLEDAEVLEYTDKKSQAERKIEKLLVEKGVFISHKNQLIKKNDTQDQELQVALKRVEVSKQKKQKIDKANQYIASLLEFVERQKKEKCDILAKTIHTEMKTLMHKLNNSNAVGFIKAVKVEILPGNDGLKVTLYDGEGNPRSKENLSQGEKQIYISSLVKAILSLSIQEFPIFIDTPLGRLDNEHIKNVLLLYYPGLAGQVVLMATNNEIPPSRLNMVKEVVSQTYLLECANNQTKFKPGYFNNYED